jgi:hypothetical protein
MAGRSSPSCIGDEKAAPRIFFSPSGLAGFKSGNAAQAGIFGRGESLSFCLRINGWWTSPEAACSREPGGLRLFGFGFWGLFLILVLYFLFFAYFSLISRF